MYQAIDNTELAVNLVQCMHFHNLDTKEDMADYNFIISKHIVL